MLINIPDGIFRVYIYRRFLFLFWRKSVGGQNLLAPSCGERAKVVWCQDQFQPLPHSWYFRRGIGALGTQSFPENWTLFRAHPKSESSKNWRPKTRNPNWHRCSPPHRQTVALVRQKRRGARKNDIWPVSLARFWDRCQLWHIISAPAYAAWPVCSTRAGPGSRQYSSNTKPVVLALSFPLNAPNAKQFETYLSFLKR